MLIKDVIDWTKDLKRKLDFSAGECHKACNVILGECEQQLRNGKLMQDQYVPSAVVKALAKDHEVRFSYVMERTATKISPKSVKEQLQKFLDWAQTHKQQITLLEWEVAKTLRAKFRFTLYVTSHEYVRRQLQTSKTRWRVRNGKIELSGTTGQSGPKKTNSD